MDRAYAEIESTSRRLRRATVVFLCATFLLIGGVVYSVTGVQNVTNRVTILEQSPCAQHAAGPECQQMLRNPYQARSLDDACIPFRLVLTGPAYRQFTRCPN